MAGLSSPDSNFLNKPYTRAEVLGGIANGFKILAGVTTVATAGAACYGTYNLLQKISTFPTRQVDKEVPQNTPQTKVAQYVEPDVSIGLLNAGTELGAKLVKELGPAFDWTPKDNAFALAKYPGDVALESLQFALETRELLKKNKFRLTQIAQFTDVGNKVPAYPTEEIRKNPENSTLLLENKFTSGHFSKQELINLSHTRLTRLNLATAIAISIVENGLASELNRRLNGIEEFRSGNWDAFNAHKGRDAGRFLSGAVYQKGKPFTYGTDNRGGVLATEQMVNSMDINDRLQVLFQPLVLALKTMNPSHEKSPIVTIEAVDKNGNPNYELIANYNTREDWFNRFKAAYKAIQDYCIGHQEYSWILTESIV